MQPIILELACGPDDQRCKVEFTFRPDRDDFIDCSLLIQLPPQLDLRLSGFLFYEESVLRLLEALESERVGLDSPVTDSDSLLTITAEQQPDWVEWSFDWAGIYPVFPPFNPDAPSNAKILIRSLRAYRTHPESSPTVDAIPENTEAEQVGGCDGEKPRS